MITYRIVVAYSLVCRTTSTVKQSEQNCDTTAWQTVISVLLLLRVFPEHADSHFAELLTVFKHICGKNFPMFPSQSAVQALC